VFAYDYQAPRNVAVRPVWIVDDDRSIRWVLEKALAREAFRTRRLRPRTRRCRRSPSTSRRCW